MVGVDKDRAIGLILLLSLAAVLWFMLWSDAKGQTIDHTRKSVNQAIRDMTANLQTTYLPDTALNRILNYAHNEASLALGAATNIDTFRIVTNNQQQWYCVSDSNSISGKIAGVGRRIETDQGGGEIGFVEIASNQIGKLGEGVIPNSYAVQGGYIGLGTPPTGGDTLIVYYVPQPNELVADTSDVTLAVEDEPAMVFLSNAMVEARDNQVNMAQFWLSLYVLHLQAKGVGVSASTTGQ